MLIQFKWFGTAGLEFHLGSTILLIDPYLSRHSIARILLNPLKPDLNLISHQITNCDHIFITHSHFDHISDVAIISEMTNADVYASRSGVEILNSEGIGPDTLQMLVDNTSLHFKDFQIRAINGKHIPVPKFLRVESGSAQSLDRSLGAFDYYMDLNLSFLIKTGDLDLLIWSSTTTDNLPDADIVFIKPQVDTVYQVVELLKPRLVVPIHWDKFWKKDIKKIQPMSFRMENNYYKIKRLNWEELTFKIQMLSPKTRVLVPQINQMYSIQDYL